MASSISILQKAAELLQAGQDLVMVTVLEVQGNTPARTGRKMIVRTRGEPIGTIGGGALEHHAQAAAKKLFTARECRAESYDLAKLGMECGGSVRLVYEFMEGTANFVLFGGGHVGTALAPILESLGFRVVVLDNRSEIVRTHEEAGRMSISCNYEDITPCSEYVSSGYAFIATHGHAFDTVILEQLLRTGIDFTYIGMIGSKPKVRSAFTSLREKGIEIPSCVFAPVGIDIGGGTPSEIALSIASEIVALRYGKNVQHMQITDTDIIKSSQA